jgi:hypothetical protein
MPQLTTSSVTVSHIGAPSPTYSSHVGDGSITSTSPIDNLHSTTSNHAGGTTLISTIHINVKSPTSVYHVGYYSLTSTSHVDSMSPVVANDTNGIDNPKHLICKTKFLCRTCEGSHVTLLCPSLVGIPEAWGSPKGHSNFEASVGSPHLVPSLIDTTVIPLQYSPDHTHIFKVDLSPIHVILHPLQPRI